MSMTNAKIADAFDQVADLLEFTSANAFRVRAYRKGARVIRGLSESVSTLISDGKPLTDLDGIGKDLADKMETLVSEGRLPMLDELLEEIPKSVLDMLRVPGLGPKKAAAAYQELGISNLDQLRAACEAQELRALSGFGAKTEQTILDGIAIAEAASKRLLWSEADELVQQLREHMSHCGSIEQLEFAGSYRRGRDTVGDLDLLVVAADGDVVMDHFGEFAGVESVIVRGDTKMSVRLDDSFQVDLRVVPQASFGAALQYFTGSKEHNVELRGRAKRQDLKINEYGVYDAKTNEYVAGATEAEVYSTLGLSMVPPEVREGRFEFEWAESGELPDLIETKDIRGDLHMHTTATDGKATLREMIEGARSRGLKYVAITDHSQRVSMANGLNEKRLLAQWEEIDSFNAESDGEIAVLKGIECDILEAGGLDISDEVLAQADWVIVSVHYGQKQSREQITSRILGALENPHVSALAHPTGRLLNRREPYEVDIDQVFAAAKQHGKLLELNANPRRLDLNEVHCAAAKSHGIPIVINTDAHSVAGLDVMRFGIMQARRAGLTKQDVANTRTFKQFSKLLGKA